jgi:hypothetical protein
LGVDNEVVPPSIELVSIVNFPFHTHQRILACASQLKAV